MKPSGLSSRLLVLIAAFATSFEAVAIAPASLLPAVAGFSRAGLRYEEARGSIWRGVLTGVEGGGYRLGDVEFELAPLSLLAGGAAVGLRMSGGAIEGDGKLRLSAFGGGEIRNARFLFDLGAAERYSIFGQRLEGLARADIVRLVFSKKGCVEAQARLYTNALAAPARRLGRNPLDLAGAGRCEAGDLVVALSGENEEGAVSLTIRLSPAMTYTVSAGVETASEDVAAALEAFGFERRGGELTIGANGTIGSPGS
jgi:hypothetical protein